MWKRHAKFYIVSHQSYLDTNYLFKTVASAHKARLHLAVMYETPLHEWRVIEIEEGQPFKADWLE